MKYFLLLVILTLFANSDIGEVVNKKDIVLTKVIIKDKNTLNTEKELQDVLKNIKKYKKNKNTKIKNLKQQIQLLTRRLNREKIRKDEKIKRLEKELFLTKERVKKKQNEILNLKEKTKIEVRNEIKIDTNLQSLTPSKEWIEIVVEDHLNIYDLALKYYGDSQEYTKIYTANKKIINSNYEINNGMSLIIPITKTFQEQPIMLNTY